MAPEAQKNGNETPATKVESPSVGDRLGKIWDTIIQKEATEAEKKRMNDLLSKQKVDLLKVVDDYKQGKTEIVGTSNQDKLTLLSEVKQTIQNLKNLNGGNTGGVNEQQGVMEDYYEKLEAKITGTKEMIDFKNPDFIQQAISNLEGFEQGLNAAPTRTQDEITLLNKVEADKNKVTPVIATQPVTLPATETKPNTASEAKEKIMEDKRKITADKVIFREIEGEKFMDNGTRLKKGTEVTIDPTRENDTMSKGKEKGINMIPVIVDGKKGYVAEKYLSKKE